ncbi:reverse transcriptase domain-containing protein [Tanacetum coccineum]
MEDEFKPSVQPQRRVNPNIKEVVKKEVIKLLDAGLIYPISDSLWVSPVQVVPKKGGMTVMLERLAGHEYYCFLDGFSGYFQIPIAPEDQEKTTCTCPYRTFAYKRMPFRLCNALATFQRCMTAIFYELIEHSMDEKCHFMVKEGIILGHKVLGSGIEVDKAKIEAISKLPYPTNVKAIRSFLGHAGFYRRFIKDFSQIARPMTQLLVKDAPFIFSEECIQAFDTLKRELTHAPIMIKPDWSLPFEIMCDASDYAVGAVLGQRINKHFKPIHYTGKTINEAQENYTTNEKELLAVVFAFDKFWQYLVLSKTISSISKICDKIGAENLAGLIIPLPTENPDLRKLNWDVLLFNSRLRLFPEKLKSRWYSPFMVSKDMKNGAIKLYDEEGSEFIFNKQRVKPYQKNLLDTNKDDDVTLEDEG